MSASSGGVLLLGATGRTGGRVLTQLLDRGVHVSAIVRSAARLPAGVAADPRLTVVEADLASMTADALRPHIEGRAAAVSCLGHSTSLGGVFGSPRDLVEGAVRAVGEASKATQPATPLRLILMSSVSVNRPGRADVRRGALERAIVGLMRALLPPARDNQRAADVLAAEVGTANAIVEWVVVRPDTLVDGDRTAYQTHEGLVSSLFRPDITRIANVAHFMVDLATDDAAWGRWRGHMPVIVDDAPRRQA